jgi:hypothetical protein
VIAGRQWERVSKGAEMTNVKSMVLLCVRGVVAGGLLGVVAPPAPVWAACTCDDSNKGHYQCNSGQTACNAGTEVCLVLCS